MKGVRLRISGGPMVWVCSGSVVTYVGDIVDLLIGVVSSVILSRLYDAEEGADSPRGPMTTIKPIPRTDRIPRW